MMMTLRRMIGGALDATTRAFDRVLTVLFGALLLLMFGELGARMMMTGALAEDDAPDWCLRLFGVLVLGGVLWIAAACARSAVIWLRQHYLRWARRAGNA
jgi:hypothetical protein